MAINATYEAVLDTFMGPQNAVIKLRSEKNVLHGEMENALLGTAKFTGKIDGENAEWSFMADSPMGVKVNCEFKCKVTATDITGTVRLGQFGDAPIKGKKI